MKCQHCGNNEANVHLRQNINGQVTEYALCSNCAEQMGVGGMFADFGSFGGFGGLGMMNAFDHFSGIGSLLGSMFGTAQPRTLPQTRRCKVCGSSFDDIANRGKLGCAECYELFADRLAPSIERMHNRAKHVGKLPGRPAKEAAPVADPVPAKPEAAPAPRAETADGLRAQLRAAVAAEEYEKAAILRDRIKEMENK